MKHVLFPLDELPVGETRGVVIGKTGIVIAHAPDGRVHALRDRCSHRGAKLSYSPVEPIIDGDDVGCHVPTNAYMVRCSWHGFEFRLEDGRCPADPLKERVKTYPVTVEDGMIVVDR
jgi:nitrite reductase/ring-hydroxylating ferredoxin subunit